MNDKVKKDYENMVNYLVKGAEANVNLQAKEVRAFLTVDFKHLQLVCLHSLQTGLPFSLPLKVKIQIWLNFSTKIKQGWT